MIEPRITSAPKKPCGKCEVLVNQYREVRGVDKTHVVCEACYLILLKVRQQCVQEWVEGSIAQ